MAIIRNLKRAGRTIVTSKGNVVFDEKGFANVDNDELALSLVKLADYFMVDEEGEPVGNNTQIESNKDETEHDSTDELVDKEPETTNDQANEETGQLEESKEEQEETTEPEEEQEESVDFDAMSVKQLEKYAREHGIDLGRATKKADIIAVLKEVE